MQELNGNAAIVTGGSKGIGYGIALELLNQGVNVLITSRTQSSADEAAKSLNEASTTSAKAIGAEADVRNLADQVIAVKKCVDTFGKLNYMIANAGLGHYENIIDLTDKQWNEVIDTNLTGVFYSIKSSVEALKKTQGYFITISSLAGTNFFAKGSAYNASKFGVTGFTQAVMLDLREHGIKVSTIMPGSVASHFNGNTPDETDAWKIQPEDIGELVVDLFKINPRTLPSKVEVRPTRPDLK
ncbi:SDR family oxidoreductase [Psychroflexus salis]|uniref:Short-chain dehydrogenase n=1 Tax=Psychroflexus salis TaxID=1526574 RepID=A0A916ZS85_9FLAO|nr:SDR family oxidoreductase [Psychroflexus salis]GGE11533.1 short-chain dehydrogenase [Psychroflexus salis]